MMEAKMRTFQVTCLCKAYGFPHRVTGGKCSGADWAYSYYIVINDLCSTCNLNHNYECQVATEQESLDYCDGFNDHMQKQPSIRLPVDLSNIAEKLQETYYKEL